MAFGSLLVLLLVKQAPSRPLSLTEAVSLAIQSRGSIQAARNRVSAAEANRSALGVPPPFRLEAGDGTTPDVGTGNDLLLALPVDLFGKARAAGASGTAAVATARAALRQAELDLQSDVVTAFADADSAQALYLTGQGVAEIAQQSYDATKKRIDAGDLPPAQLLRADLELQRAKQALELREQTLASAKLRLASALGVPVSQISGLDAGLPESPPSTRLEERADLATLMAEAASDAADARIASSARLPDLELQFSRSFWDMPEQYNARFQVVLPLYDYGSSGNRIRAARLSQKAAGQAYADRLKMARVEVEASRLDLEAAKAASLGYQKLTQDAQALIAKEQRGFTEGASTLLDVLDSIRALRDIEESAADAHSKWILAEGKYLSATGALLVNPH